MRSGCLYPPALQRLTDRNSCRIPFAFAPAAAGIAEDITVENDLMIVTFNTKGGTIKQVELKNYFKITENEDGSENKLPLYLLEDEKNRFEYTLPVNGVSGAGIKTSDLYFTPDVQGKTITMRAPTTAGGYFEHCQQQRYHPVAVGQLPRQN